MFKPGKNFICHGFAIASVIATSVASAPTAFAGECPADKMKPNVRPMVDYKPSASPTSRSARSILKSSPQTSRIASCAFAN